MITSLHQAARALGGEIVGAQIVAPGPGHSPRDRSLRVAISASSPQGFIAHSFAGDDWQTCRDYVASRLGLDWDGWKRDRPDPEPNVKPPIDQQAARNLASAAQIIRELRPIATSPDAMRYFEEARRIDTKAIADVLSDADAIGWHPECFFREDGHQLDGRRLSCIVAVMTDPATAKATAQSHERTSTKVARSGRPRRSVRPWRRPPDARRGSYSAASSSPKVWRPRSPVWPLDCAQCGRPARPQSCAPYRSLPRSKVSPSWRTMTLMAPAKRRLAQSNKHGSQPVVKFASSCPTRLATLMTRG